MYSNNGRNSSTQNPIKYSLDSEYELGYTNLDVCEDSIGTTWIQVIFEVRNNSNNNQYLSDGEYTIFDNDNNLVLTQKNVIAYPQVIKPGESAYYYERTIIDYNGNPEKITIIKPQPKVKIAQFKHIDFPITDLILKLTENLHGIEISGSIENITNEVENLVFIGVIFLNAKKQPIGIASHTINDLEAYNKKIFYLKYYPLPVGEVFIEDIADYATEYKVVAFPYKQNTNYIWQEGLNTVDK